MIKVLFGCGFVGGYTRLSVNSILSRNKPYTTAAKAVLDKKKEEVIPTAKVKWYYATDVPLSKPAWFDYTKSEDAKKFIPFSDYDSKRIENQYRQYHGAQSNFNSNNKHEVLTIVEVNEDRLFQVNIREFSLAPVYWEGPVYEVRRGIWFTTDGIPLSDKITRDVEAGYRDKKPYLFDEERKKQEDIDLTKTHRAEIAKFNSDDGIGDDILDVELAENDDLIMLENDQAVLFLDDSRAVMFPQSMINTYQLPIIRKFGTSPVALMGVTHIQRGFTSDLSSSILDNLAETSFPDLSDIFQKEGTSIFGNSDKSEPLKKSTNYSSDNDGKEDKQNEQMKEMIEEDFENETTKETSSREVDHLVFCIHGIGQILGSKYESINFAHNINTLRNTMKSVFKDNPKFKKLAYHEHPPKQAEYNNRIQVLPIAWRHRIDFHPNKLPLSEKGEEPRLPTLAQINVDGVRSLRNVIGDVALDILLYYESRYFSQILSSVTEELNRVYKLYKERNPDFKGKVHILGHSLGSAIAFDIASYQENKLSNNPDTSVDLLFDIDGLFCIGCPVGVFKLLSQKNIVNRKDLPADFNPRSGSLNFASPKCNNLYNLYHPCDPIGYRIEPLIKPRFAQFKAEEAPFAVEGFNSQIKGLTAFTDDIQERISKATSWFLKTKGKSENDKVTSKAIEENALGDIVSSIVKAGEEDVRIKSKATMPEKDLKELIKFNRGGRVDYCLPMGVFDISLVSAISAHVSYFEDKDTAGFVMGELLSGYMDPAKSKEVLYKEV